MRTGGQYLSRSSLRRSTHLPDAAEAALAPASPAMVKAADQFLDEEELLWASRPSPASLWRIMAAHRAHELGAVSRRRRWFDRALDALEVLAGRREVRR